MVRQTDSSVAEDGPSTSGRSVVEDSVTGFKVAVPFPMDGPTAVQRMSNVGKFQMMNKLQADQQPQSLHASQSLAFCRGTFWGIQMEKHG